MLNKLRSLPILAMGQRSLQSGANSLSPSAQKYFEMMQFRANLTRFKFIIFVVVPTAIAILFYSMVGASRYVSEARFIVRSVSTQRPTGIDMLFRTFGLAKTVDDSNVIQKYILSRDAIQAVIAGGMNLKAIFTRPEADRFSRYPRIWRSDSSESLYDYFQDRVVVQEDAIKGIVNLRISTFRPTDSQLLAQSLLQLAESMVNRMNERAQKDAMDAAFEEVSRAQANVIETQTELANFRNREVVVDPSKSVLAIIDTIGVLSTDLAHASADLSEMKATSPNNPGIGTLRAKIASLEERITTERAKTAGKDGTLAAKIAIYEQLVLRRDLADKSLAAALNSLDSARQEARRQHIYIEEIVAPNLPDEATEPERLRSIISVFVLGFALFSVTWILSVGAGEHKQL